MEFSFSLIVYYNIGQFSKIKGTFSSKKTAEIPAVRQPTAVISKDVTSTTPVSYKNIYGSYGVFPLDIWTLIISFLDSTSLRSMLFVHPRFVPFVSQAAISSSKSTEQIKKISRPTQTVVVDPEDFPTGTFNI